MRFKILSVVALIFATGLSACGSVGDEGSDAPAETADMALNVDLKGDTDVAGFKFILERYKKNCSDSDELDPTKKTSAFESLEELYLPGGNPDWEKNPYDPNSEHHFSDHLFTVKPGCYRIIAKPVKADKTKSDDCSEANLEDEQIAAGTYNEFHLISQCQGRARSTVDVVASLNHPPVIKKVDLQKFTCAGAGVHVCVTATDPDNDPLRITFKRMDQNNTLTTMNNSMPGITLEDQTYDPSTMKTRRCATIQAPSSTDGTEWYKAVVKDLAWDGNQKVPIEELLQQQDSGDTESHATAKFPVYEIDPEFCIPAGEAFIGTTFGADVACANQPDPNDVTTFSQCSSQLSAYSMSATQGQTVARNAVNFVNPNLLGDPNPHILLVLDDANPEDKEDAPYIRQLLKAQGFTDVNLIMEPSGGLQTGDVVGYKVVWFVNPGYPIDDPDTVATLKEFREHGGGVIVSGDDAAQAINGISEDDLASLTFLDYLDDNGASVNCNNGSTYQTDNNAGKRYRVIIDEDSPLAAGLNTALSRQFNYGNDIDKAVGLDAGEIIGARTSSLTPSDASCSFPTRDVMTTVEAGIEYTP